MTTTLLYSPSSPFVRKVLVLLHETGQFERVSLREAPPSPVSANADVFSQNPAGKIPALSLPDGSVLHDSRVIVEYFDSQHDKEPFIPAAGDPQRFRRLTLASLADALLDAAILLRYETALRPEQYRWDAWIAGQQRKIEQALHYFEREALTEIERRFDVASLGLACGLSYLDFRHSHLNWRDSAPGLAAWYAQVSQRPSLRATEPR